MFRQLLIAFVAIVTVSVCAFAQPPQPRLALIIANSQYQSVTDLPNAANDSDLMADTLERIGFDVTVVEDADRTGFAAALETFSNSVPEGAIVLVYYSGHGIQAHGENYLIPVDAAPRQIEDLASISIAASDLLRDIAQAKPAASILILDACRDNPFREGPVSGLPAGMASIEVSLSNNLVAFSTSPGKVAYDGAVEADGAGNSPYTKALAASLVEPGLSIESVFKRARSQVIGDTGYAQIPWENSSLTQEIFLIPGGQAGANDLDNCDLLAGHPTDPQRVHAGVAYQLLRPAVAIPACREALSREPDNPRFLTQLARALEKAGEYEEAVELNLAALNMDYLGAFHNLGNLYRKGAGVPRDQEKAFELFEYAAERGHPEDAYNLGVFYLSGTEQITADNTAARLWFERAAAQDYPSSFDRLGIIYRDGLGVEPDFATANDYFRRGTELGDAGAIVNLATAYRKGTGVDVDFVQALELYHRAAQLRRTSAYVNLGEMYLKGQGADADPLEAAFWLGLAMRDGNEHALELYQEVVESLAADDVELIQQRISDWLGSNFG